MLTTALVSMLLTPAQGSSPTLSEVVEGLHNFSKSFPTYSCEIQEGDNFASDQPHFKRITSMHQGDGDVLIGMIGTSTSCIKNVYCADGIWKFMLIPSWKMLAAHGTRSALGFVGVDATGVRMLDRQGHPDTASHAYLADLQNVKISEAAGSELTIQGDIPDVAMKLNALPTGFVSEAMRMTATLDLATFQPKHWKAEGKDFGVEYNLLGTQPLGGSRVPREWTMTYTATDDPARNWTEHFQVKTYTSSVDSGQFSTVLQDGLFLDRFNGSAYEIRRGMPIKLINNNGIFGDWIAAFPYPTVGEAEDAPRNFDDYMYQLG
jgi:hypothetical protein